MTNTQQRQNHRYFLPGKLAILVSAVFFTTLLYGFTPLKDARGITISSSQKPMRIISGSLVSDEILLELLANNVKRLLAVSFVADDPKVSQVVKEAKSIPQRVGDNSEKLLTLNADLVVFATFNRVSLINTFTKAKLPLFVIGGFQTLEDIRKHIRNLGEITHQQEQAKHMILRFDQKLRQLKTDFAQIKNPNSPTSPIRVLALLPDGIALGKNTLFDDYIREMGLNNITSQWGMSGWSKLSQEKLLLAPCDWLITVGENPNQVLAEFSRVPFIKRMPAFIKRRVIVVPPAYFSNFSQHIVKTIEYIKIQMQSQLKP